MGREYAKIVYLDHLGNEFSSVKNMCDSWGIHILFVKRRIKSGMSLARALETPMNKGEYTICVKNKYCVDHKRHSFKAMCYYWKKSSAFVKYRLNHGLSLQEALEENVNN